MDQVYVVRHKVLIECQSVRSVTCQIIMAKTVSKYLKVSELKRSVWVLLGGIREVRCGQIVLGFLLGTERGKVGCQVPEGEIGLACETSDDNIFSKVVDNFVKDL